MDSFQHLAPAARLFSGPDSLGYLGRELDRVRSERAVIVCGASLARNVSALDMIHAAAGGRCAGVYSGARARSPIDAVEAGVAELKRLRADAVIAVGGGSAMVTARAINILMSEGGDLRALATSRDADGTLRSPRLLARKLPQIAMQTTPNTATIRAGTAVYDPSDRSRHALFDPKTRAGAVFIHPTLLATAPRALVSSAAIDSLVSAIDGLTCRARDPIADGLLMHAVRLIVRHVSDDDSQARMGVMLGAILAGQGADHTGAGLATALGHAIGATCEIENAMAKAIVLPAVLRFNGKTAAGLDNVVAALGTREPPAENLVDAAIDALRPIFAALAVPGRLRDAGVRLDALPEIAAKTMGDWFHRGNARPVRDAAQVHEVLLASW